MSGKRKAVTFEVDERGCHVCTSHAPNTHGYPFLWKNGRPQHMHRVLFEETHGTLGPGLVVLHACDNRMCINLDHLSTGTPLENSLDCDRKGRRNPPCGTRAGNTHLTDADVIAIKSSTEVQHVIAKKYGITQPQVSRIKTGTRWNHLQGETHERA